MHRLSLHVCLALLCATASSQILPFELADVQLAGATFQAKAASSNVIYLLETLDVDRLLWSFRKTAQLATPGEPYRGSWEDPFCELRGHFVGHYLSALAQLVKSSGDARAKSRLDLIVVELSKVQAALGGGYLSAFPSEHFDRLEALKGVWAPYYVIHKIMIGLVDAHLLAGNAQALDMVSAMADYFYARSDKLIQEKGRNYWTRTLETEFGGMNEVMYRLFRITKKDTHLKFAGLFDKPEYWNGLLAGKDVLPYHHANTHLAQVVGFAERYETTSEDDARKAVSTFFDILTANHSFATGGSNWKEFWHSPATLANAILKPENAIETQEICTQYNILKIARALFRWTGDVKYADFYEQALVNGILGVSRLSADEVMDQEEDNLDLLNKLLHKHKKHNHNHDHDHDHAGSGHDHLVLQGRHVHMDEDLTGHSLTGHTPDMFGAGITWSDSTMQGELNLDAVPETHFHRAGAPGRASMETMKAASKAQEPSWTATPDGDLLTNPYAKGVASGAVAPWQRSASLKWQNYWGYNIKNMDPNDTSNVPGTPGSFLYLLTLGSGMSKRENIHHWGYPLHSFWCCYGTAVESFSKLGDSIYFWVAGTNVENKFAGLGDEEFDVKLPRLYINQYVSSTLAWKDMGLQLTVKATMYAPGPAMVAAIDLSLLEGTALASKMQDIPFTMLLRMPAWARRSGDAQKAANVSVNGQAWGWQDSDANAPGSYLEITRRFKPGDVILVTIGHSYWINPITDSRPQYKDYAAIMMGPYVMAGLTHDASWLTLPSDDQSAHIHEPPVTPEGLISVQSAANASLYLRVDHYHSYVSTIEDSGDALDATVIIRSGCTKQPGERQEAEVKEGTAAPASGQQLLAAGLRSGHVVMLEAMGQPGFYLGSQGADGKLVWEQQTRPGASGTPSVKHPGDMGAGTADAASHAAEERLWCDLHSWRVVPGLDGGKDTFSLELVGKKDYYLTGVSASGSHKCEDEDADKCSHAARAGLCISEPELWVTRCPLSCMSCKQIPAALYLVHLETTGQDKTARSWASWHWAPPAAPKYPPGAKVIRGVNRHFLLAPLGNLVDERYTVYFKISMVETHRLTASPEVEADL